MSSPGVAEQPPPAKRPALSARKKLAFALVPLLLLGLSGEVVVRLRRGALLDPSDPREARIRLLRSSYPAVHHPRLGYVLRPGAAEVSAEWGSPVTIDAEGFRSNGPGPPPPGPPILALGDSFTFGDEVGDADSWPAQLESRLQRRVLNGGVFGYGLDQVVLRGEALLDQGPQPAALVLSFIADDVVRCQYSFRSAPKPYFAIANGALVLENVPVAEATGARLRCYSHLIDALMVRLADRWWHGSHSIQVHDDGIAVSRLLIERLARLARARGIPLLIVTQGWPTPSEAPLIEPVVAEARRLGLPVLDLWKQQAGTPASELAPHYIRPKPESHMSAAGNAWVAEQIATAIRERWPKLDQRKAR